VSSVDRATARRVEDLLRELAPQVLASLVRRTGRFDDSEDAVQLALVAASTEWVERGIPDNPRGWLVAVARRRLIDQTRSEVARRQREEGVSQAATAGRDSIDEADDVVDEPPAHDDSLILLVLCCHPSLTPPSQIALTLRAVGGLTTAEIAGAFFVPEATMAQRISRAKERIRSSGARFELPAPAELDDRLRAVLHVLYLIFTEGHASTSGPDVVRADLSAEAIRLTRLVRRLRPDDTEVAGLLALMLLTDARRPARVGSAGELVPLADQDRARWDRALIDEGVALITDALADGPVGAYQLQAAINAVHDEAPSTDDTDWLEILGLYDLLARVDPSPMVPLNRAIAVGKVFGPEPALAIVDALAEDPRLAENHRRYAVRAHLLEDAGRRDEARAAYVEAARRSTSLPERRHLEGRAHRLS